MRQELPSLAALQAFEAALRHRSFTRAARELARTQGAISRQVAGLEAELGCRLFHREHPRVRPTPAAEVLGTKVRAILDRLAAVVLEARSAARSAAEGGGVLNLAILPTFGTQWLIPRVRSFHAAHPGVMVHFATRLRPFDFEGGDFDGREPRGGTHPPAAPSGEGGEHFDAAIHHGEPDWPGAHLEHLMDEQVIVVSAPELLAELGPPGRARPEDLFGRTLLQLQSRPSAWPEWLEAQGVTDEAGLAAARRGPRFEHHLMVIQAAIAGLGVALLPTFLVQTELAEGRLATPFPDRVAGTPRSYWLAYPERSAELPALVAFRAWLRARLEAEGLAQAAAPTEPAAT
jgi:LysR family glycine cleavage system transcriptional activator